MSSPAIATPDEDGLYRVGVRELNQQTRRVLDLAREGLPVIVTDHGRPIARIVPFGLSPLERLIAEGEYVGTTGAQILDLPAGEHAAKPATADSLGEVRQDRA